MKKLLLALGILMPMLGFAQPSNDECASATSLTPSFNATCSNMVSATLQGATASGPVANCGGTADDDVWFTFSAVNYAQMITVSDVTGISGQDIAIMKEVY